MVGDGKLIVGKWLDREKKGYQKDFLNEMYLTLSSKKTKKMLIKS